MHIPRGRRRQRRPRQFAPPQAAETPPRVAAPETSPLIDTPLPHAGDASMASGAHGGAYLLEETSRYFEEIAKKYKVSLATVHRWRLNGLRGRHMEAWLCGARWITSEEAVIRFFEAVNAVARGGHGNSGPSSNPGVRSAAQRHKAVEAANREAQALGC